MRREHLFLVAMVALISVCVTEPLGSQQKAKPKPAASKPAAPPKREPGLYATFDTTMGKIVCQLFEKDAPKAVANFVDLAEARKAAKSPATKRPVKKRFYDGIMFHRVIPNFMIQAGDPMARGDYEPGYAFEDEFKPHLKFDRAGRLAMANRGPNTNGTQFFITVAPTPHLNNKHTIFGQVVEGQEVANKISMVKTAGNKPLTPVVIQKVTIERVP